MRSDVLFAAICSAISFLVGNVIAGHAQETGTNPLMGDSRKPSPTPLHRATSSTQTPSPSRSAWPAPARCGFSGPGRLSAWETTGAARSMEAPGGRPPRRWGPTRIPRIRTTTSSSPRDPGSAPSTRPTTRGRRPTTTCSWWEDPERARPATTSSRTSTS